MEQAGPRLQSSHGVSPSKTHRQGTSICPPPGKEAQRQTAARGAWPPPAPCVTLDEPEALSLLLHSAMRSGQSTKDRGQTAPSEARG